MSEIIRDVSGGQPSLRFYCGGLVVDGTVRAAGHEPNGYFWEGILAFLDPSLAGSIELDSEAGMFASYGNAAQIDRVQAHLEPLLSDPAGIARLIERAEAAGHEFED